MSSYKLPARPRSRNPPDPAGGIRKTSMAGPHAHSRARMPRDTAEKRCGSLRVLSSRESRSRMQVIITRGNNVYGPAQYPEKAIRRVPCAPLCGSGLLGCCKILVAESELSR